MRDSASVSKLCSAGRCPTLNIHLLRTWRHAISLATDTISRRPVRFKASCRAAVLSPVTIKASAVNPLPHTIKASSNVRNSQNDWCLEVPVSTFRCVADAAVQRTEKYSLTTPPFVKRAPPPHGLASNSTVAVEIGISAAPWG